MPYPTPTLKSLQQQAVQDIQAAQITNGNGTIVGLLQKAVLRVLALVLAGFTYLLFDFLRYIALQSTPWGATDENAAGWGALKGIVRKDAIAATGTWTSGAGSTNGTPIDSGTQINRQDGTAYVSTATVDVSGGVAVVPVRAVVAGAAGTINVGDLGALAAPISGVSGQGTFTASGTAGADQETQDAFKARYLVEYAAPPQGGAFSDYIEWAEAVPAVTRAWCLPNYNSIAGTTNVGVVSVLFMEDIAEAAYGGFPQGTNGVSTSETRNTGSTGSYPLATGDQLNVVNQIFPDAPVTALIIAGAPTSNSVTFGITGLLGVIPSSTRTLVTEALQQMFLSVGTPGGTTRPDGGTGGDIYPSDWEVAISEVPDMPPFQVTAPTTTVTSAAGALPVLGTVNWSP